MEFDPGAILKRHGGGYIACAVLIIARDFEKTLEVESVLIKNLFNGGCVDCVLRHFVDGHILTTSKVFCSDVAPLFPVNPAEGSFDLLPRALLNKRRCLEANFLELVPADPGQHLRKVCE